MRSFLFAMALLCMGPIVRAMPMPMSLIITKYTVETITFDHDTDMMADPIDLLLDVLTSDVVLLFEQPTIKDPVMDFSDMPLDMSPFDVMPVEDVPAVADPVHPIESKLPLVMQQ